jgi:arylsulfatase A-like enzyme
MNFQRGFRVFDWIRGQERDRYRPKSMAPEDVVERNTVPGNDEAMVSKVQQYVANTRGRRSEEDYFAPRVFARGMEFMERSGEGQPFLLVLDSFDPHEPWDPPEEYASLYSDGYDGRDPIVPNYGGSEWIDDAELERMRALYAGEVTMVDRWFGRFMDSMEAAGRLDDTAVIVLADHGVALGEHGFTGKPFNALWPELTDIPFMIRHPEGLGAGETSDFFASTHDVAPTILGILGLLPQERMDGQFLSILMEGGELEPRDHFTLGYADHVWARDDRYLMFSRRDRSEPHLYDLQNDPETKNDLAERDPDRVRRMFEDYVLADAGGSLDG